MRKSVVFTFIFLFLISCVSAADIHVYPTDDAITNINKIQNAQAGDVVFIRIILPISFLKSSFKNKEKDPKCLLVQTESYLVGDGHSYSY